MEKADHLHQLSRHSKKFDNWDLEDMIKIYSEKVLELKKGLY
jgi:hypothetical protein